MSAIGFLLLGFGSLVLAFAIEGGHLGALLVMTAAMIVFGGTIGALGVSFPFAEIRRLPAIMMIAFGEGKATLADRIMKFVDQSSIVRREGVLALEGIIESDKEMDLLTRTGMRLVVDGVEPDLVREVLETHQAARMERHKGGAAMLEAAGGFAPTMGILGTVMGLVHVLGNLSDPGRLGPAIAVAFIATLYGVASANLFWLPLANKLKALDKVEQQESDLIIEGVMQIARGANPRMVWEKLQAYLEPKEMEHLNQVTGGDRGKAA